MKQGQYIRLFLSTTPDPSTVVAAAKQMALHGSAATDDSTTKDTTGNATESEVTGLSYDISGSGLILTPTDAFLTGAISLNDFEGWLQNQKLYWQICVCEGTNNRTIVETICSGTGKLTNLQISAQVKTTASYNYTLTGDGGIVVGEYPSSSEL